MLLRDNMWTVSGNILLLNFSHALFNTSLTGPVYVGFQKKKQPIIWLDEISPPYLSSSA